MNFIAILIALGVEIFYKPISHWRDYQWFTRYEQWLYGKLENASFRDSAVTVVLVFGLVFLVTAIIGNALYDFFALIGFLFATLVLIYSIGPDDLDEDVQAYLHDIEQNDAEGASHHAEKITGQVLHGKPAEVAQQVKEAIFIQGNVRMLGVIFWFVLLGPAGALLFRLSDMQNCASKNQSSEYAQANQRLFYILSWLPARLSVLGYAVVGNFIDTLSKWNNIGDFWQEDNDKLVIASALGALQHEEEKLDDPDSVDSSEILEALALVKRMLVFWLAILALLTLSGTFF